MGLKILYITFIAANLPITGVEGHHQNKREDKKKPAMTPKEKKAAKRTKKEGKLAASA
jgi:hypothetical protein